MHIVITVNAAWNIANFRGPLIEALIADGHRITALVPDDDYIPVLQNMGCAIELLEMDKKGISPKNDLKLVLDMRAAFKKLRPDIVFSFTIKNNIYGAFAIRGLNIPFVPNVTGLGTAFLGSPLLSKIAQVLYRQAFKPLPHIIFQNADDRLLFEKLGLTCPEQAVTVPGSGIDLTRFVPSEPSERIGSETVFLMIARVLADKGVREYAEAARLCRARFPDTRFQLLGELDASNRSALSAHEVNGWVEEGAVEYLGHTGDVRPYIATADCLVLPSYREGAPRALIEGAAMARPMVTTDVPGCRHVVRPGETGFLCEARSGPDLARAIQEIIALSPDARAEMGQAARVDMEVRFSVEMVIDTYRGMMKGKTSASAREHASAKNAAA